MFRPLDTGGGAVGGSANGIDEEVDLKQAPGGDRILVLLWFFLTAVQNISLNQ